MRLKRRLIAPVLDHDQFIGLVVIPVEMIKLTAILQLRCLYSLEQRLVDNLFLPLGHADSRDYGHLLIHCTSS